MYYKWYGEIGIYKKKKQLQIGRAYGFFFKKANSTVRNDSISTQLHSNK